jgi:hypothetical protein
VGAETTTFGELASLIVVERWSQSRGGSMRHHRNRVLSRGTSFPMSSRTSGLQGAFEGIKNLKAPGETPSEAPEALRNLN